VSENPTKLLRTTGTVADRQFVCIQLILLETFQVGYQCVRNPPNPTVAYQYCSNEIRRVLRDFWSFIRYLGSVVESAALKKSGYPQVPGSIPAENMSTQIHMDLSKYTLKQEFYTTVSSNKSNVNQKERERERERETNNALTFW